MGTYCLLESSEKFISGVYVGCDPNLKYQKCLILEENTQRNEFKVRFNSVYMGNLEVSLDKKDIFLA